MNKLFNKFDVVINKSIIDEYKIYGDIIYEFINENDKNNRDVQDIVIFTDDVEDKYTLLNDIIEDDYNFEIIDKKCQQNLNQANIKYSCKYEDTYMYRIRIINSKQLNENSRMYRCETLIIDLDEYTEKLNENCIDKILKPLMINGELEVHGMILLYGSKKTLNK